MFSYQSLKLTQMAPIVSTVVLLLNPRILLKLSENIEIVISIGWVIHVYCTLSHSTFHQQIKFSSGIKIYLFICFLFFTSYQITLYSQCTNQIHYNNNYICINFIPGLSASSKCPPSCTCTYIHVHDLNCIVCHCFELTVWLCKNWMPSDKQL